MVLEQDKGGTLYLQWKRDRLPLEHLFQLADDSPEQIRRYRDLGDLIIAANQSDIVGHAQVIPSLAGNSFELKSIAVLKRHRRRGIGSALLEAVIGHCRDRAAVRLTVSTAVASFGAIRFYLRHGFRATAVVRDAFPPSAGYPLDAMLDGLPLNDALEFELMLESPTDEPLEGT